MISVRVTIVSLHFLGGGGGVLAKLKRLAAKFSCIGNLEPIDVWHSARRPQDCSSSV